MNFMNEDSRGLAAWRNVLKKEYYHMDCAPMRGKVKVKRLWDPPTPREEVEVLEQVKGGIVKFCQKKAKAQGSSLENILDEIFRRVDKDKSGQLQRNEFITAIKYDLGLHLNEKQAHAVMQWLDKDGNGQVSYSEFVREMTTAQRSMSKGSKGAAKVKSQRSARAKPKMDSRVKQFVLKVKEKVDLKVANHSGKRDLSPESALIAIFREYDADGNYRLTRNEFFHVIGDLGLTMSDADKEAVFRAYDGGDGSISYQEFIKDVCQDGQMVSYRTSSRPRSKDPLSSRSRTSNGAGGVGQSARPLSNSHSLPAIGKCATPAGGNDSCRSFRSKEEEKRKILKEMKKLELEIAMKRNAAMKLKMERKLEEERS